MIIFGLTVVDGWFFSKRMNYYQNRKGMASSYIERMIGFYRVHVTFSGPLGMCDIEIRKDTLEESFTIANKYLEKYKGAKRKEELWEDYYSPHNPKGYWTVEYPNRYKKELN